MAEPRDSFTFKLSTQAARKNSAQTNIADSSPKALCKIPNDNSPKIAANFPVTPQNPNISPDFDSGAKIATTVRPADCVAPKHNPTNLPANKNPPSPPHRIPQKPINRAPNATGS